MVSSEIGVVVVTYDRLEKLKIALNHYENQSCKPKYVLVVDNNSGYETKKYLEEWMDIKIDMQKYCVFLNENVGGSGGFYEGMKAAIKLNASWIWLADDDAYADEDAILTATNILNSDKINKESVAAICGSVINNGQIDLMHRRNIFMGKFRIHEVPVDSEEYKKPCFSVQLFSYVGCIINKKILENVGLTQREYFIYYDDTEHSMRLSAKGNILCFPKIKIIHNSRNDKKKDLSWREYYAVRNKSHFYKKYFKSKYLIYCCELRMRAVLQSLIKFNYNFYKVRIEALHDADNDRLGIHPIYKPGWNFSKV